MTHVFVICPFHPVELNETSQIFISSNIVWKWLKLELEIWIFRTIWPKTVFQTKWTKNTDKLKIYLVWFSSTVRTGQFALKFFAQRIWKENVTKYLCYLHKFSVQDHLHEHYCTFEQFCVVSDVVCVALRYFFFIIKREPLVGETLIEIESAVARQQKSAILFLSKHSASDNFLPPSKGYLKTHFKFSFGINIKFIYSNSP